jgi:hypothetical protein
MKKISYLLFLSIATILPSRAQQIDKDKIVMASKQELQGTYQLEFLKGSSPIALTSELLQKISVIREEDKDSYFMINETCRVHVFARSRKTETTEEYIIVDSFN